LFDSLNRIEPFTVQETVGSNTGTASAKDAVAAMGTRDKRERGLSVVELFTVYSIHTSGEKNQSVSASMTTET
jgi:hypothetical protein